MPPDFAIVYHAKTDDELIHLAGDPWQLTPEALNILIGELNRRRLEVPTVPAAASEERSVGVGQAAVAGSSPDYRPSVKDFIKDVMGVYGGHFWLFIKLSVPAVLVGYVAIKLAEAEGRDIARHLPKGLALLSHRREVLEIWSVNMAGFLTSWLISCLSFAVICSAVEQRELLDNISIRNCLERVWRALSPILRVSVLLFVIFLALIAASQFGVLGVMWLFRRIDFRLGSAGIWITSVAAYYLSAVVLSRLGLAIPAVVLDSFSATQSLFRSDELTDGKWLILSALLLKAVVGGYIAAMLPLWIRVWIWSYIQVPGWFATTASFAFVSAIEPILFVGLAVLYQNTRGVSSALAKTSLRTS